MSVSERFVGGVFAALLLLGSTGGAQVPAPNPDGPKANWALFDQFSSTNLKGMTYSTSISPRWIGETDSVFYSWRDHTGEHWYLVDARKRTRKPLFNHVKLAAQLSVLKKKAVEAFALNEQFTTMNITRDHKSLRFASDSVRYNWNIATETLTALGRYRGIKDSLMLKDEEVSGFDMRGRGGRNGRGGGSGKDSLPDVDNWSPDSTAFVFARSNNLFLVEQASGDTTQITHDGIDKFSFANGRRGRGREEQDSTEKDVDQSDSAKALRPSRPNVTWSLDSKAFHITRTDNRGVKELFLVRSLTQPRPTLKSYPYPMPGEDSIPKPELWTYVRGDKEAKRAPIDKWRDQRIMGSGTVGVGLDGRDPSLPPLPDQGYWVGEGSSTIRFVRRDRLQRNLELVELDVASGASKVLVSETKGDFGSLEVRGPVYVKEGGDFIWFSERDGWGHYYLYANDGTLKRQLTSGPWRSDAVIAVDSTRGIAWIRGEGREPGENPYNRHLYRVGLADASIKLLDPADANHTSSVSKSGDFLIDLSSRVDLENKVQLRDARTGKVLMDLESTDLSRLKEIGWKPPEPFQTLAADGVTPIYGNLWKPFDFDSTIKYPIIANVYPGPQTEAVSNSFSPGGGPQQLAQLGFIVIQIGNRGGTPARSAAYQDFGYFDLRDYALADKKAGIEQLAARHPWIDIDRVGIYGHSGGGFLTAAALLLPPYNEFFKVGVSESGNHDNNIYNNNWSEQYHGLKWVAASDTARLTAEARSKGRSADFAAGVAIAKSEFATKRTGRTRRTSKSDSTRTDSSKTVKAAGRDSSRTGIAAPAKAKPDSVFWIYVPTNIDIANNLKGKLLLETGDEDSNVSPSNTIRLINALIKSNKRFDMMIYPGRAHSYGPMAPYAFQLQAEYFAEFLLGDRAFRESADFGKHR